MSKLPVINMQGERTGEVDLADGVLAPDKGDAAVHQAVLAFRDSQRAGTAHTLGKGAVAGSGKKPYKQKGTGRARAGTNSSPLWKGGGVVFAPKARDYSQKVNKKVRNLAMRSVFSDKVLNNELRVLDALSFDVPKTKEMIAVLDAINAPKALIVTPVKDEFVLRSSNNIPKVHTTTVEELNVYDMLKYDCLVLTKDALDKIEEVYAK